MNQKDGISTDPLTGVDYVLPQGDDKQRIDGFLSTCAGKPVVAVQGLGFVGAVMALVVANAPETDYAVLGVDLASEDAYWKIQAINDGRFPIVADDPKIYEFFQNARAKGNFYATYDAYAYSVADVIIVDVNLDVDKASNATQDLLAYDVDLRPFKSAIRMIGQNCKPDALILVETTVPPGTSERIVRPILTEELEKRQLESSALRIGHSYERVMPGPDYIDSIQNFYRVYSGIDELSAQKTEEFLKSIIRTDEYPLTRLGNTNATEMAKVLENSYRAMNIAFMVEWSRFAEEAGVNIYEVVNAIRMRPTHKNLMLPGLGVGGYCLTKDPLMASWARKEIFKADEILGQSEMGVRINDKMPLYAFEFLCSQLKDSMTGMKVVMLGASYRQDVGDTRYSPAGPLYDYLVDAGAEVSVHDPHVRHWTEKALDVHEDVLALLQSAPELIIVSTGHSVYKNNPDFLNAILRLEKTFVYDTIGIFTEAEIRSIARNHRIKILGRGDL